MSSPPSRKPRVAVVFGGRSTEHAISCVSAGSVLAAVDRERFDVVAVGISPEGRWVLAADDPSALEISGRSLPAVAGGAQDGAVVALPPDPARRRLVVLESGQVPRELGAVDVVFPMLHGPYGEDGTIQGMLEMAGVPYVGSGVLASAVTMDKEYMKLVLAARGLPVGPYVVVRPHDRIDDVLGEVERLGFPVFVKPARGGSSLGISKVGHAKDLGAALVAARAHDPKVLVEKGIAGRELECGVLEGARGGAPEASVVAEVRVVSSEFYDFEAKYLDDSTEFDVPADIPDVLGKRVQDLACRAFEALSCEGLARVDFFYPTEGELLVNEVNTMPGFTPMSMFPRMWAASGVDYSSLVRRLLANALSRRPGLR